MNKGWLYRLMRQMNRRMAQNYKKGFGPTRRVLLLTTTGRKSGLPRQTPLQYDEIDGAFYLGSARGAEADWFRNIQAHPQVEVQVGERCIQGVAEATTDPVRIADFFQARLKRSPIMIGLLMRLEGLPWRYTRADLERFAAHKAMVVVRESA